MKALRWITVFGTVLAMSGLLFVSVAQAAEIDLFARLAGSSAFPNATGTSEYDRGAEGRDVEITVRHIAKLAGKRVTFYVAGHKIGTAIVRSTGVAHIERDTEHGQYVPKASAGKGVSARTVGGTVIARGIYHAEVDND